MRSTSGRARSSHQATFSRRAFSELTFQVAIRTARSYLEGERRGTTTTPANRKAEHRSVKARLPYGNVEPAPLATLDGSLQITDPEIRGRGLLADDVPRSRSYCWRC